ncbi:uncharacterized protein LOC115633816 [Scaptodrosophila lebanonensis]|uniref:Uncharacterized protein LOC115633816 n=1 Tax=Drosophila lebanonensis TaxID=7225 RepID=A0A6J2UIW7_DROLE|nr:uncharacterized protein LOC115633816 [Scaptodrosophila lebanonensis]
MLNKCCFMRLHTAGMVIGWVGIVGSFISVIVLSVVLANVDELVKAIVDHDPNVNGAGIRTGVVVFCSIALAFAIINLLSSTMLVVGTVKERHLMLVPWLVNSGAALFFSVIQNITVWIMMISNSAPVSEILPYFLFAGLALAFQFYIYYGIYSLFKHIQAGGDQQSPLIRPVPQQSGTTYPSYTKM